MSASPRHDALAALSRTLEARTEIVGIAIFEAEGERCVLRFATPAFRTLSPRGVIPPTLRLAHRAAPPLRVTAAELGLVGAECLMQPIFDPSGTARQIPRGFVVLAQPRPRKIGPLAAAALRDAAEIAGLLLDHGRPPHLPPSIGEPATDNWVAGATPDSLSRGAEAPAETLLSASVSRLEVHRLVASVLREQGRRPTFALVDIDRFRAINEGLGAEAADAVLAVTASRIEGRLGAEDRLIRLEGDRFLIVTAREPQGVRDLADAVLTAVARPLQLSDNRRASIQASVGVVLAGGGESAPVRLLMEADSAVQRAKAEGGGRVEVHEPRQHAAILERSRIELDLRHALDNGELALVYQPYVALATGEVTGVEALLRWRHPARGDIAPATFIPLAEATGLILPIGGWALRMACQAATSWPGDLMLSVNISAVQFHAPSFLADVKAALAASGLPAARLELEITESVLMRDDSETNAQLQALVALGVRIALDDFGTGYSALAYLSRLPHHRIKLDKTFLQDVERPKTAALIRAITQLARANGIDTTAEGVESESQLKAVAALGFSHAQGFATGVPAARPYAAQPCGLTGLSAR